MKDDVLSESSANITKAQLRGYEYVLWPDERQTLHTSAIKSAIMAISPNCSYKSYHFVQYFPLTTKLLAYGTQ